MNTESVKYQVGQIVYSKINSEIVGQVTGILFRSNHVSYLITWSDDMTEKYHSEFELTPEKEKQII